ncbi:MAG: IS110 family transposase, partial [Halobacteriovoraceae bacterium]|nr:IS110 family transposase [Halobacteriovoraceae bacterium]
MQNLSLVGIDIAKNVFHLHGVDSYGKTLFRKKLSRGKFSPFIANLSKTTIVMETCSGANHFARKFISFGHEVKLIAPKFVKPFV